VAEPLLDLRDVGFVVKGVGRGRGAEGMDAETRHIDAGLFSV